MSALVLNRYEGINYDDEDRFYVEDSPYKLPEIITHYLEKLNNSFTYYDSNNIAECDLGTVINKDDLIIGIRGYNLLLDYVDDDAKELFLSSIEQAIGFINKLPAINQMPTPEFTKDGEILLIWNITNKKKAMVTLYGTEEYGYTYKTNGVFVPGEEEAKVNGEIPKDLYTYLQTV